MGLQQSKPNAPFNLLIGVQRDSKLVLIINHQQSFQEEIWPRFNELYACFRTQQQLLRLGLGWITNLTYCTLNAHLFIGMLEKEWRKESFPKHVRIWLHWKRTTKRLEWTLVMAGRKKEMNIELICLLRK